MTAATHYRSRDLLKRLLKEYVLKHKRKLILATACMLLVAGSTAANAWIMQPVLDEIFVKRDATMLTIIPLCIMVIALISGAGNYGQTVMVRYIGQRVIADMQLDLFAHLMRADLGTFHDQASGRLISRFTNDINMMRHSISNVMTGLAREMVTLVFLVVLMFYQSWELSIIALIGFPLAVFPITRLGRRMRKISDGTQAELGEFTAQLDESFQGARVVKAYGREDFEWQRASSAIERLFRLYYKAARVQAVSAPIMEILAGIAIALVIWYGGYKVLSGVTSPGAFFSFITAMLMVYRPIKSMASLNTNLQEGLAAANRFFQVMDVPATIKDAQGASPLAIDKGNILLEAVKFRYGQDSGGVEHITLNVPAGAKVALVGASGSGKSTIMNLILRFYDVEEGAIYIDDQDIRNVTLASLRGSIALVSQDVVLFEGSVRDNIAYGNLDATHDDIIHAATQADAHEFISQLPQGYDTLIGPHGVRLSGGQRQRLSIARAMLKNAPILLLDEATSALDSQSERSVQRALDILMQERTTIMIAHRLSTIAHADIIYVIEHGRIVESGTHTSLIERAGRYRDLYMMQFSEATSEA